MKAVMYKESWWTEEDVTECYSYGLKLLNAGFEILGLTEHEFDPQGYTVIYLLSESHLAIHTFPEENQTYFELTSCVKEPFDKFMEAVPALAKNKEETK